MRRELTEAVTRAVLPVKSSAPHMSTSKSPKGRPKAPYTIFCSPGFVDARPGQAPPTDRARKLPKPMKVPPRMPIMKVLEMDRPAFVCPAAVACTYSQSVSWVDPGLHSCLMMHTSGSNTEGTHIAHLCERCRWWRQFRDRKWRDGGCRGC